MTVLREARRIVRLLPQLLDPSFLSADAALGRSRYDRRSGRLRVSRDPPP